MILFSCLLGGIDFELCVGRDVCENAATPCVSEVERANWGRNEERTHVYKVIQRMSPEDVSIVGVDSWVGESVDLQMDGW